MTSPYEQVFGPVGNDQVRRRLATDEELADFNYLLNQNSRKGKTGYLPAGEPNLRTQCDKSIGCLCDNCVTKRTIGGRK